MGCFKEGSIEEKPAFRVRCCPWGCDVEKKVRSTLSDFQVRLLIFYFGVD